MNAPRPAVDRPVAGRPMYDVGDTDPAEAPLSRENGHVTEPFGTEEPMVVSEPAAAQGSEAVTTVPDVQLAEGETADTRTARDAKHGETAADADGRPAATGEFTVEHLIEPETAERLRHRWREVKGAFVDDPSDAVRRARGLTDEAVEELIAALGRLRQELDGDQGEGKDTERLRVALRGYGSLIDRVLAR